MIEGLDATQERIAAIRARAEAATPGPWSVASRDVDGRDGALGHEIDGPPEPQLRGQFERKADADFIANAREDVPWLLDERDAIKRQYDLAIEMIRAIREALAETDDVIVKALPALLAPPPPAEVGP